VYDPVDLARQTEKEVGSGNLRKYYRFRAARFYGGIATADCVGCCLRCLFCWSWNVASKPARGGGFYHPADVARRLEGIAKKKRFGQVRISGNEPTLCWDHLVGVLEALGGRRAFILETNGILLGENEERARDLSRFSNLHVRVSLKGACEDDFARCTGARPEGFALQLGALENLARHGVSAHPACMVSFSAEDAVEVLKKRLREIHPSYADFEKEELVLYPHVEERLRRAGIVFHEAWTPDRIPPEQV
jgi:uncharacterized Fe-S cluster-containing radical SAM superfamily protein